MDYKRADKIRRFAESCKKDGCEALISPDDLLAILEMTAIFELDYFRLHEIARLGSIEWKACESGLQISSSKFNGSVYAGESFRDAIDMIPKAKPRNLIFNKPD